VEIVEVFILSLCSKGSYEDERWAFSHFASGIDWKFSVSVVD